MFGKAATVTVKQKRANLGKKKNTYYSLLLKSSSAMYVFLLFSH